MRWIRRIGIGVRVACCVRGAAVAVADRVSWRCRDIGDEGSVRRDDVPLRVGVGVGSAVLVVLEDSRRRRRLPRRPRRGPGHSRPPAPGRPDRRQKTCDAPSFHSKSAHVVTIQKPPSSPTSLAKGAECDSRRLHQSTTRGVPAPSVWPTEPATFPARSPSIRMDGIDIDAWAYCFSCRVDPEHPTRTCAGTSCHGRANVVRLQIVAYLQKSVRRQSGASVEGQCAERPGCGIPGHVDPRRGVRQSHRAAGPVGGLFQPDNQVKATVAKVVLTRLIIDWSGQDIALLEGQSKAGLVRRQLRAPQEPDGALPPVAGRMGATRTSGPRARPKWSRWAIEKAFERGSPLAWADSRRCSSTTVSSQSDQHRGPARHRQERHAGGFQG